ncbi:MAG: hypothetical protein WA689_27345, partial [Trebonia sp.]
MNERDEATRAETVGSLLRDEAVVRAARRGGPADAAVLDDAARDAIRLQEEAGLDVITDGEYRRFSFFDQIVSEIDGTAPIESAPVHFKNAESDWVWHNPFT